MAPKKVLLVGSTGKLGSLILKELLKEKKLSCAGEIHSQNTQDFVSLAKKADLILDVSSPKATCSFLKKLDQNRIYPPYIVGCTGWDKAGLRSLTSYSKKAITIFAPNFSPAIQVLYAILKDYSGFFKKWGYQTLLEDFHHVQKKDSPSGTAKELLKYLDPKTTIECTRKGKVVGTHRISFIGKEDAFSLEHKALDRKLFARGAILVARETLEYAGNNKKTGIFSVADILTRKI